MKANQHQPHLPLIAFFETVFLPLQLRNRAAAYAEQFRTAIRWLAAIIGQEPLVGHLNRETMRSFTQRLAAVGLAALTTKNVRKKIWQVWRYADELGYAEQPPIVDRRRTIPKYCRHPGGLAYVRLDGKMVYLGKHGSEASRQKYAAKLSERFGAAAAGQIQRMQLPPDSGPPARAWLHALPADSLLAFYRRTFRPELAPQICAKSLSSYDAAITWFHDFVGRPIAAADVTPPVVDDFRSWLDQAAATIRPQMRTTYRGAIRRIMRAAGYVERFPKFDGVAPLSLVGAQEHQQAALRPVDPPRRTLPLPIGEPGTLLHFYQTVYALQAIPQCSDVHRDGISTAFRHLRRCFDRELMLDELSREKISEFMAHLSEGGAGLNTVKNTVNRLMSIWRFAHNECAVGPPPPKLRKFRIPRQQPDSWTLEEAKRIVAATDKLERPPIGGVPAAKFWRALLLIGWWTALRRGSLVRIRQADIDLAGFLYIPADRMKGGVGKRFKLGDDAIAAIAEILDPPREMLFPVRPDAGLLSDHFTEILRLAGVDKRSRLPGSLFHRWRRTVCTEVARRHGVAAASSLLAHSDPGVTVARYIDQSRMPLANGTDVLPSLTDLSNRPDLAGGDRRGGLMP